MATPAERLFHQLAENRLGVSVSAAAIFKAASASGSLPWTSAGERLALIADAAIAVAGPTGGLSRSTLLAATTDRIWAIAARSGWRGWRAGPVVRDWDRAVVRVARTANPWGIRIEPPGEAPINLEASGVATPN
jgi:hypothetical protein